MALSNWDTLAFNSDGEPSNGILNSEFGSFIEIYKNWLYVSDEDMWKENRGYVYPVIAEIYHGNLNISNFDIKAERGPQNSVFVFVKTFFHLENGTIKYDWMAGIGGYGYSKSNWVGITSKTLNEFFLWIEKMQEENYILSSDQFDEWFSKIKSAEALRFNQGDAYFEKNLGIDMSCTPVGEAEEPIISHFIKGE